MQPSRATQPGNRAFLSRRNIQRAAAVLLLLYVLATTVAIVARLSAPGGLMLITPISDAAGEPGGEWARFGLDRPWYDASHGANLAGSFLLVAAAAISYRVFRDKEPTLALTGASMFLGAAFFTGAAAIFLMALGQGYYAPISSEDTITARDGLHLLQALLEPLRALSGRVAFTFAALGSLAYGGLIAWNGSLPRWLGWLGLAAGLLMFFIWREEAAALHRLGGGAYLLWLTLLAGWLFFRGTPDAGSTPDTET